MVGIALVFLAYYSDIGQNIAFYAMNSSNFYDKKFKYLVFK